MDELKVWDKHKSDLLVSINATIKNGNVDQKVLEIMKELVESVKLKKQSMNDYFEDLD